MKTVSFDFDLTLYDEEAQAFIPETLALLRKYLDNGHRVIITTGRMLELLSETKKKLTDIGLDIEVFCAPGNASDPSDIHPTKSDVLISEKAIKHYDDMPKSNSLDDARAAGIEILMPPATKAIRAGMY